MKKIAFILPLFKNGGAEKTISTIASLLAEKGYEVNLIIIENKIELTFPKNLKHYIVGSNFELNLPKNIKKYI